MIRVRRFSNKTQLLLKLVDRTIILDIQTAEQNNGLYDYPTVNISATGDLNPQDREQFKNAQRVAWLIASGELVPVDE